MSRRPAILVVSVLPLVLSGCVYYNTFYHARIAAREAEAIRASRAPGSEPGARETELLERVAEKCSRVLRDHPDSGWADDALVLLARALYEQGKHESAREHLTEFARLHPGSPMRAEADYLLGAVLIAKGDPVGAEDILARVADANPPTAFSDDALALIGEARNARERYDEAAEAYLTALERFPGSELRARVRFLAAENCSDAGLMEEAAHHYAAVAEEKGGRELAFEARVRLGEVLVELGQAADALAVLKDLERRTQDRDDLDRVLLLEGRAHEEAGDLDSALSTYEGVSASHPRSDASALAFYRRGLIERDRRDDLSAALEAFEKARDESSRSEGGKLAAQAARDVEKAQDYLATIARETGAPADSAGAVPAATSLLPESGRVGPAAASAPPDSTGAVVSNTGVPADAATDSLGTVVAAPDSGGTAPRVAPAARSDLAEARFLLAELYLFRMERPEKALALYRDVVTGHPGDPLAPKAALAAAWTLENRLDDPPGAGAAYADVVARYPGTDYAEAATDALARLGASAPAGP